MPAAGHSRSFSARDRPASTRLHRGHGPTAGSPTPRTAAHQAGRSSGGQGLLVSRDPRPPAQVRYPGGGPGPGGPAWPPAATRQPGWQATGLRPRGLQAAQHRRTVQQPPQAVARYRHPLREDRDHLPRWTSHCRHLPLVRSMIQTKALRCSSRRAAAGRGLRRPRLPAGCRCGVGGAGGETGDGDEHRTGQAGI